MDALLPARVAALHLFGARLGLDVLADRSRAVADHYGLGPDGFTEWLDALPFADVLQDLSRASDEDLVLLWQAFEDHDAFALLLSRHTSYLRNVAFRILRSDDAAAEAAQAASARMPGALRRFTFSSRVRTYLHSVVANEALMLRRSFARQRVSDDEVALDHAQAQVENPSDPFLRKILRDAIAALTPDHRAVFLAVHQEGLTHEEAASRLGISPALARQRAFRARRTLRQLLKGVA